MEIGILSLLPPVLAIVLALAFKNVFIALFMGVFSGQLILAGWNPVSGINNTLYAFIKTFESNSNVIVLYSIMFIGGITYAIEQSGGIGGFIDYMTQKRAIIKSKKGANMFTWILGVLVFTSGTLSALVTGAVSRPINDAMKVPHEKSSFIVHTTTTPVSVLIPLSGWGAFMIGLIEANGVENGVAVLWQSIPLNFYCLIAVLAIPILTLIGKDFGLMKKAEERAEKTGLLDDPETAKTVTPANVSLEDQLKNKTTPMNLIAPLGTLILTILVVLTITGEGNLTRGAGMQALVWGVFVALVVAGVMYISQKIFTFDEYVSTVLKGGGNVLSMVIVLIFAFAMGATVRGLDTGPYLANALSGILTPALLPAIIFIISCLISFSTGTSTGTMTIMMALAMPMALTMDVNIPLTAAAVFGGSIFGDHSSPISDTTIMASSTTGADVMDHIRSQLQYTLFFAAATIALYVVFGFIM